MRSATLLAIGALGGLVAGLLLSRSGSAAR